jgi:D-3-phosphoglycerate dehydrogenase / 2-oxoglutarate reductase
MSCIDRITVEPGKCGGRPCIRGYRLRVKDVSLHCPPRADGKPLLDQPAVQRLKVGCCLINTARAKLVDEAAVLQALESGMLRAYATDVFDPEPPPPSSPLLKHERVIATPHISGFTQESVSRATLVAVENLLQALSQR